ncbi:MAG TPA: hypothetical protein VKM93_00965 [Terriglobia bacterium]|nr:hypothetical protein [Terriglobia bacterium]
MKHRFLLDSNIIYFAVKEEDKCGDPDLTSARLLRLIGENCHTAVVDDTLLERYEHHIRELLKQPRLQFQMVNFLTSIRYKAAKLSLETAKPPELPSGVRIPPEDEHVVRAALISKPIVVTDDQDLSKAIKRHQAVLSLTVMNPSEALELAKDK